MLYASAFLHRRFSPTQTQSLRPIGDAVFNASPTAHPQAQPYSLRPFCMLSHFFCGMDTTTAFRAGRGVDSKPRTLSCRTPTRAAPKRGASIHPQCSSRAPGDTELMPRPSRYKWAQGKNPTLLPTLEISFQVFQ